MIELLMLALGLGIWMYGCYWVAAKFTKPKDTGFEPAVRKQPPDVRYSEQLYRWDEETREYLPVVDE